MTQKTYALLDLIGITTAIEAGQAATILESFWSAADAWTSSYSHPSVFIPGQEYRTSPDVYVSTFSDSGLLHTGEELNIDDFIKVVRTFKQCVENSSVHSYVIISRNDEIPQSQMHAFGGASLDRNMRPKYIQVAGSGNAWINLHRADAAIKKHKEWHGKYSIYCVGKQSCPTDVYAQDSIDCEGLVNANRIFAIE